VSCGGSAINRDIVSNPSLIVPNEALQPTGAAQDACCGTWLLGWAAPAAERS
jgi:hypothetical protein